MGESFLGLEALLHVHVESAVQQVGEIVEFHDAGAALSDSSGCIVYPALDVAADLLLLFDFAYRELRRVRNVWMNRVLS